LDGQPLTICNHENLIMLFLPAGEHGVEFHYGSTPIQWVGWGVTVVCGILILLVSVFYSRLRGWFAVAEGRPKLATTDQAT